MAIRGIRTEGDDILRKKSRVIDKFDQRLWQLLDDMADTLGDEDGVLEFLNPEILETSGSQRVMEGCLSFPGQWGMITRPDHVKIRAQDRNGNWFEKEGSGLLAQAMLHESGHLDGHAFKEDPTFSPLTEEEAEALSRAQEEK